MKSKFSTQMLYHNAYYIKRLNEDYRDILDLWWSSQLLQLNTTRFVWSLSSPLKLAPPGNITLTEDNTKHAPNMQISLVSLYNENIWAILFSMLQISTLLSLPVSCKRKYYETKANLFFPDYHQFGIYLLEKSYSLVIL